MSTQIMARMFEPDFTTKGHRGSGLGLSISRRIIEHHSGKLQVESEEGRGTTFTIHLPLAEPQNCLASSNMVDLHESEQEMFRSRLTPDY